MFGCLFKYAPRIFGYAYGFTHFGTLNNFGCQFGNQCGCQLGKQFGCQLGKQFGCQFGSQILLDDYLATSLADNLAGRRWPCRCRVNMHLCLKFVDGRSLPMCFNEVDRDIADTRAILLALGLLGIRGYHVYFDV